MDKKFSGLGPSPICLITGFPCSRLASKNPISDFYLYSISSIDFTIIGGKRSNYSR